MNCHELEAQLTPYLDGELIAEARLQVETHLAECQACAMLVERERHLLGTIRDAARSGAPRAPDALRARLFDGVRRDAVRRRNVRVARLAAVAAGVVLLAGVSHQQYRSHQRSLYERDAAMRHARHFPLEIEQAHTEALEQWFGGKLDHRVALPQLPNARAAGARILQVRDKPAAYVRYDTDRRHLGLFVFEDGNDVDVGPEPAVASSHGYNVVSWRRGDVVYQLVSDLDERDIRELLAPAAPPPTDGSSALDVRPASLQR
jgi:anti-sigma factor RsiW